MHETKILGLSGKKQAGKNTAANFILGSWLKALEIVQGNFKIIPSGELYVSDVFGQTEFAGIFDINSPSQAMLDFRAKHLDEIVRIYSFADYLKDVCMTILGLSYEQCYGSNEDKNSATQLKWEDMPGILSFEEYMDLVDYERVSGNNQKYQSRKQQWQHKTGQMTAREVLQFVGTEIFRKMYNNVWVDALIRRIQKEKPTIAIITDVRFPNEVDGILNVGGKVIRLLRKVYDDSHESETALDNYPLDNLIVINNNNMTIQEQNAAIEDNLHSINWWPQTLPGNIQL